MYQKYVIFGKGLLFFNHFDKTHLLLQYIKQKISHKTVQHLQTINSTVKITT